MSKLVNATGALVIAAGVAGCAMPRSDNTVVFNDAAHTGAKAYGSEACDTANVAVYRSNSIGMAFNSTVINGYTYPAYATRNSPYSANAAAFSYLQRNPGQVAEMTATSNTGEVFTLIPGPVAKNNTSLLGAVGLAGGLLIGGGTGKIAAAIIGTSAGIYGGQQLDQNLQTAYRNTVTRCVYDVETGAYNRPGGPIKSDLAYPNPLSTWNGRIDYLLPRAPGR